jgi:hypothetical protein
MKRSWYIAGLALAAVSVIAPPSRASVASEVKQEIQAIYNQADSAAARRDVNDAVAYYGDPGLQNAVRQGLSQLLAMSTSAMFSSRVVSVNVPKDNTFEATVIVKQHFQGLIKHNGRIAVGISDAKVRQYWTKQSNRWVVLKARVLSIHRTLNSQPVRAF